MKINSRQIGTRSEMSLVGILMFLYNFQFSNFFSSFGTGGASVWTKGWRAESVLFSQAQFYTKILFPLKEMISHTIFQISPLAQINAIKTFYIRQRKIDSIH